ncbi:MAG: hypothetical protein ACI4NN_00095 [Pyramidobacter sp.]|jgi:hypothetical protein
MRKRKLFRWLVLSFLAGALWCVCDRYQPFRLKAMKVDNFTPELEMMLRSWSETFLTFHPAWLLARSELKKLERRFPLTIKASWSPLRGTLQLTAVPFKASMKLEWQHADYLAGEDGTVWPVSLWQQSLKSEIPDLPSLLVNSKYPLLDENVSASSARLKVPYAWLFGLWQTLSSVDSRMKVENAELLRRGGEDLVSCSFRNDSDKTFISFIGRVSALDKSILIVRELIRTQPGKHIFVDATYGDKVIIRKSSDSSEQKS